MYYLVTIDDGDYSKIEFKFGSWKCAQEFIDTALIHSEIGKASVKVQLCFCEDEEEETNTKENE